MRKKSALAVVVLAIILAAVLMVLKPWATRNPLNLESFPQVSKVETNSSQSRTQTIVHLRDWHFVPYDQFVLDQNQLAGKELSQDELAALWGRSWKPWSRCRRSKWRLSGSSASGKSFRKDFGRKGWTITKSGSAS